MKLLASIIIFLGLHLSPTTAFNVFQPAKPSIGPMEKVKKELVDKCDSVARGLQETPGDREQILDLVKKLEARNPTKKPVISPLITARWRLVYTTSDTVLGRNRLPPLRPAGPIYQVIDGTTGRVRNEETLQPLPFLTIPEAIEASITPEGPQRVNVQFDQLQFGPFKFKFSSKNFLDITYLDDSMRISRGGYGNVFVLVRDD